MSHLRVLRRRLIVLTPLVENCPGPTATKPGDIVRAMNGKSIKVDNTDAEGRLILADALCYADEFKPATIVDVATLTGAIKVALGAGAAAVFTSDDHLWTQLQRVWPSCAPPTKWCVCVQASVDTGDRVWRMPIWQYYADKVVKCAYADTQNIASNAASGGGSCIAAGFLRQFTECAHWAHVDIAGVMDGDGALPYVRSGMTGRPTRTLIQWLIDYESVSNQ